MPTAALPSNLRFNKKPKTVAASAKPVLATATDRAKAFKEWLSSGFTIPAGISRGRPLELHPFQMDFVEATLARDGASPFYRTCCFSLGRKLGKSSLLGAMHLGWALPDSPIFIGGYRGAILAPTARLGGYIPQAMLDMMEVSGRGGEIMFAQRPQPGCVKFRSVSATIQLQSGSGLSGHGSDVDTFTIDEAGLMPPQKSELFASAFDAVAARDGQLLLIGVRATGPQFNTILESKDPRTHVALYGAGPTDDPGNPKTWGKAIPPGGELIKSGRFMEDAFAKAKAEASTRQFQVFHLNQRIDPAKDLLVQYNDLAAIYDETAELLPDEPVHIGVDLGGSSSMTASAVIGLESGVIKVLGAFPSEPFNLAERGKRDFVGDLYVRCYDAGELLLTSGQVSDLDEFLPQLVKIVGDRAVHSVSADRYRKAEFSTALARQRIEWPMIWRGTGPRDGDVDIRAARRLIMSRSVRMKRSVLLEASIAEATVKTASTGAVTLEKSTPTSRIDVVQSAVLALSALLTAREMPAPEYEVVTI